VCYAGVAVLQSSRTIASAREETRKALEMCRSFMGETRTIGGGAATYPTDGGGGWGDSGSGSRRSSKGGGTDLGTAMSGDGSAGPRSAQQAAEDAIASYRRLNESGYVASPTEQPDKEAPPAARPPPLMLQSTMMARQVNLSQTQQNA
jgi:hypothetical protein